MAAACLFLAAGPADGGFAWAELVVVQFAAWVESHPLLVALLFLAGLAWLSARIDARRRVAQLRRREAQRRTWALLREHLTAAQYHQLLDCGYLEVPSRSYPHRCYRIPCRRARVQVYEAGRKVGELCVVACDPVPDGDLVLTHKWMIEANEPGYLAIANWAVWTQAQGRGELEAPLRGFF
jgi:hypothetical protein